MRLFKRIGGLGFSSLLTVAAAVSEHATPEHALLAAGFATFLTHVLAHFTASQAEVVLAGFEQSENHDLEFALAAAYREALKKLKNEKTAENLAAGDIALIDAWIKLLNEVKSTQDASFWFKSDDAIDPAKATDKPDVWRDIRRVLARWAEPLVISPALDTFLSQHLPNEIQTALQHLVRTEPHQRAWIAWQQSFFKATYQQARKSDKKLRLILAKIAKQNSALQQLVDRVDDVGRDVKEVGRDVKGIDRKVDEILASQPPRRPAPQPADITRYLTNLWNATRQIEIKNLRTSDSSAN